MADTSGGIKPGMFVVLPLRLRGEIRSRRGGRPGDATELPPLLLLMLLPLLVVTPPLLPPPTRVLPMLSCT